MHTSVFPCFEFRYFFRGRQPLPILQLSLKKGRNLTCKQYPNLFGEGWWCSGAWQAFLNYVTRCPRSCSCLVRVVVFWWSPMSRRHYSRRCSAELALQLPDVQRPQDIWSKQGSPGWPRSPPQPSEHYYLAVSTWTPC